MHLIYVLTKLFKNEKPKEKKNFFLLKEQQRHFHNIFDFITNGY